MKIPMIWLNDFVQVDDISPEQLAEKLVNVGFEVEEIIYTGSNIERVVTGKILDIQKHIDADRLSVCMVDVGAEITTIVTAATNIRVGNVVPVALDGAVLPTGKTIHTGDLRGVTSYGMFCSGAELKIDDSVIEGAEVDGILILPPETPIGQDIKTVLGLDDYVLDVSVTANRPDCQSVYGIAREVGAVLGRKVKQPNLKYKTVETSTRIPSVTIVNGQLCTRYEGRLVTDVKIETSPKWMRDRLRLAGIRPINNLVDITNFVLLEIGQPLHAFDLRFVDGDICVRTALPDEKIVALDGNEYKLQDTMLVIADDKKPLAIAGVMGGEYSGIMPDTTTVFLEAARFDRGSIRTTSRTLGLRSDSSARYEKGVDWFSVDMGRERALSLISQLKAGKITTSKSSAGIAAPAAKTIHTTATEISGLLGIEVKVQQVVKILKALCFDVVISGETLTVVVPGFRTDVENYTDLAEEVIRYYGYENIQSTFMATARPTVGGYGDKQENVEALKDLLCGYGAYEIMTYGFINRKQVDMLLLPQDSPLRAMIEIKNPLSEEYAVMRTQLAGSMLKVVYNNTNRKNESFRLFEIARTFRPQSLPLTELPNERLTLSIALTGADEGFYALKEIVGDILHKFGVCYTMDYSKQSWLHPGISADILTDDTIIGSFGKVHPKVMEAFGIHIDTYMAEIDLETFIGTRIATKIYQPLPKFPAVNRDLAVLIDDAVPVGHMIEAIRNAAGCLCEQVELFDIYKGAQIDADKKSVAFSLAFRAKDRTLNDAEVQTVMNAIVQSLENAFDAQLRM